MGFLSQPWPGSMPGLEAGRGSSPLMLGLSLPGCSPLGRVSAINIRPVHSPKLVILLCLWPQSLRLVQCCCFLLGPLTCWPPNSQWAASASQGLTSLQLCTGCVAHPWRGQLRGLLSCPEGLRGA